MAELRFENVNKVYNKDIHAVKDFNLKIKDKELTVFVGPSGCGKTTTLQMLAGLEEITSGSLFIAGEKVNHLSPQERNIAMVFQNYALYPHLTVYDNIAFSLKQRKINKKTIKQKVQETATLLGIETYLNKKPKELSGGQQQRVALGRAFVRDAEVFLMDEPLSNLDAKLRIQMRTEIKRLHRKSEATIIYVTHDQIEAMSMATQLVVMKDGMIQQIGTPQEIYHNPATVFVGDFIGSPPMNFITGTVKDKYIMVNETELYIPPARIALLQQQGYANKNIIIGIRPEAIEINKMGGDNYIAKVEEIEQLGAENLLYCSWEKQSLAIRVNHSLQKLQGDNLSFHLPIEKLHFFDAISEKKI